MINECELIEFKLIYTDKLYKEIIAFANTGGGRILIGVENDGTKEGVLNLDETYNKSLHQMLQCMYCVLPHNHL